MLTHIYHAGYPISHEMSYFGTCFESQTSIFQCIHGTIIWTEPHYLNDDVHIVPCNGLVPPLDQPQLTHIYGVTGPQGSNHLGSCMCRWCKIRFRLLVNSLSTILMISTYSYTRLISVKYMWKKNKMGVYIRRLCFRTFSVFAYKATSFTS